MNKCIKEERIFNGPRFKVSRKIFLNSKNEEYIRDIVDPGNAVVILPITEKNEVVFVKEYREAVGKVCLGLPAGMIDENEEPIVAAKRELSEETGIIAEHFELLNDVYASCGYTTEKFYIYLAKDFKYGEQHLDETEEIISVEKIPIEKCLELAKQGYFKHANQNIAILMYYFKYMM